MSHACLLLSLKSLGVLSYSYHVSPPLVFVGEESPHLYLDTNTTLYIVKDTSSINHCLLFTNLG